MSGGDILAIGALLIAASVIGCIETALVDVVVDAWNGRHWWAVALYGALALGGLVVAIGALVCLLETGNG
jgi:hypothetical protein